MGSISGEVIVGYGASFDSTVFKLGGRFNLEGDSGSGSTGDIDTVGVRNSSLTELLFSAGSVCMDVVLS